MPIELPPPQAEGALSYLHMPRSCLIQRPFPIITESRYGIRYMPISAQCYPGIAQILTHSSPRQLTDKRPISGKILGQYLTKNEPLPIPGWSWAGNRPGMWPISSRPILGSQWAFSGAIPRQKLALYLVRSSSGRRWPVSGTKLGQSVTLKWAKI